MRFVHWARRVLGARLVLGVRLFLSVLLCCLALASPAQTLQDEAAYYKDWLATAKRAEAAVDAKRASSAVFEGLRSEIAEYRELFVEARDQNAVRIRNLQSQLNALGPAPEGGAESEDIAALRQSLTEQLASLRVPRIVAEEAYVRANGLIGEIDRIIRDRQARRLLSRGPSPLNPALWAEAASHVNRAFGGLINETATAAQSATGRATARDNLPAVLLLVAFGLVLVLRGTRWAETLGEYLRGFGGRGSGVWSFVVSLARIFLPLAGVMALVQALSQTGLLGTRGEMVLQSIPGWAATILLFNWLARRILLVLPDPPERPLPRRSIKIYVSFLAIALILQDVVSLIAQMETLSDGARAVIAFGPILFAALVMLRLQQVALRPIPVSEEPETRSIRLRPILRRVLVGVALLAPLLAAFGFVQAAEAIAYPMIETLALIVAVIILQRLITDIYAWISGFGENARDTLFSALVNFVLSLAALPLLALIWGARTADLTEVWARFLAGFQIGETRISPVDFLTFALIFATGYVLTRVLQSGLRNNLLPKTNIDPGGQNAIVSGTGYIGIFLAAIIAITGAGLDLSSLAIVAGALSVGIGFGLQNIVSNFVSGIILLIERPISKGDWIEVGGQHGYVRDISVRSTRIETFDRTDVIVPNSDLISGTVTNYTRGNTVGRVIVPVGVAYGTDTRRVEKILSEIANGHPMALANPPPSVVFQGFGADSLDFEIRAILRDVNWVLSVKSDLNHEIAKRFTEEGIEIPFAQRDLWIRNPEALGPKGETSG